MEDAPTSTPAPKKKAASGNAFATMMSSASKSLKASSKKPPRKRAAPKSSSSSNITEIDKKVPQLSQPMLHVGEMNKHDIKRVRMAGDVPPDEPPVQEALRGIVNMAEMVMGKPGTGSSYVLVSYPNSDRGDPHLSVPMELAVRLLKAKGYDVILELKGLERLVERLPRMAEGQAYKASLTLRRRQEKYASPLRFSTTHDRCCIIYDDII